MLVILVVNEADSCHLWRCMGEFYVPFDLGCSHTSSWLPGPQLLLFPLAWPLFHGHSLKRQITSYMSGIPALGMKKTMNISQQA